MNYFRHTQMLNKTIYDINAALASNLFSKSQRFAGGRLYGICEQAIKTGSQSEEFPAVFDLDGNGVYAGIDDTFNFILYHRKNGLSITDDVTNPGFGDNVAGSINTYTMTAIVFFNRKRLQMEADEFAIYIQRNFPPNLDNDKFHYLSAWINSVILNSQQVFGTEYKNVSYFLKPEHCLMAINYTIEGKPKLACFNRCPE